MNWERDPFTLIEEDGYFFGRGTLDNKFGVVTLSSTFMRLKREGYVPLAWTCVIGFTGDEETGMETTRALVTTHRALTDAGLCP
jgi:carboxypeptidase PM20D1